MFCCGPCGSRILISVIVSDGCGYSFVNRLGTGTRADLTKNAKSLAERAREREPPLFYLDSVTGDVYGLGDHGDDWHPVANIGLYRRAAGTPSDAAMVPPVRSAGGAGGGAGVAASCVAAAGSSAGSTLTRTASAGSLYIPGVGTGEGLVRPRDAPHWLFKEVPQVFVARDSGAWATRDLNAGFRGDDRRNRLAVLARYAGTEDVAIVEYGHLVGLTFPVEERRPETVALLRNYLRTKSELIMSAGGIEFISQRALRQAAAAGSFTGLVNADAVTKRMMTPVVTQGRIDREKRRHAALARGEPVPESVQQLARAAQAPSGLRDATLRAAVTARPGSAREPNRASLLVGGGTAARDFVRLLDDGERAALANDGLGDGIGLIPPRPARRPVSAAAVRGDTVASTASVAARAAKTANALATPRSVSVEAGGQSTYRSHGASTATSGGGGGGDRINATASARTSASTGARTEVVAQVAAARPPAVPRGIFAAAPEPAQSRSGPAGETVLVNRRAFEVPPRPLDRPVSRMDDWRGHEDHLFSSDSEDGGDGGGHAQLTFKAAEIRAYEDARREEERLRARPLSGLDVRSMLHSQAVFTDEELIDIMEGREYGRVPTAEERDALSRALSLAHPPRGDEPARVIPRGRTRPYSALDQIAKRAEAEPPRPRSVLRGSPYKTPEELEREKRRQEAARFVGSRPFSAHVGPRTDAEKRAQEDPKPIHTTASKYDEKAARNPFREENRGKWLDERGFIVAGTDVLWKQSRNPWEL
jgi:hypothetical protein